MGNRHDADKQFSENLEAIGRNVQVPEGVTPRVRSRCMETLAGKAGTRSMRAPILRRAGIFSTVGLAAAIIVAVSLLPWSMSPSVKAAVVLEKLTAQVAGDDLLDVMLDSVGTDEANVNGRVQVGTNAIAGDLKVSVNEQQGLPSIQVDLSIGISADGGWVLIRELKIPDSEMQQMINLFFPEGTETLLILPDEIAQEFADGKLDDELGKARSLVSGELAKLIKEVLSTDKETGVETREQADGTVLLTLTVKNAQSLRNLIELAADAFPEEIDKGDIDIDDSDVAELVGGTLSVLYDPASETVRSFTVSNVGEMTGTISISFRSGDIDPAMLDSRRVARPGVRTLDVGALKSLIERLNND